MFAAVPVAEPEMCWERGGIGLLGVAVWKYPHESWARTETENHVRGAKSGGEEDVAWESLYVRSEMTLNQGAAQKGKVGESKKKKRRTTGQQDLTRFVQLVTGRCVCQRRDSRKGLCVSPAHPVGSGKSGSQPAQRQQPPHHL